MSGLDPPSGRLQHFRITIDPNRKPLDAQQLNKMYGVTSMPKRSINENLAGLGSQCVDDLLFEDGGVIWRASHGSLRFTLEIYCSRRSESSALDTLSRFSIIRK